MNIPVRYPALVWTAVVAAVFSLIVGLLMTLDFVGRGKFELFDSPEYLQLKQQLKDQPGDEQVQQAIRDLDLHLRDSYFRNRRFLAQGMYMLLGGVVLTLVAARWACSLRRQAYLSATCDPEIDAESASQRYGKWAAVSVVAIVVGRAVRDHAVLAADPAGVGGPGGRGAELAAKPPIRLPARHELPVDPQAASGSRNHESDTAGNPSQSRVPDPACTACRRRCPRTTPICSSGRDFVAP